MARFNFFTGMAVGIGLCGLVAAGGVYAAKTDQEAMEARNAAMPSPCDLAYPEWLDNGSPGDPDLGTLT